MEQDYSGEIPVDLVTTGSDEQKANAAEALENLSVNGANQERIASAGGTAPPEAASDNDEEEADASGASWTGLNKVIVVVLVVIAAAFKKQSVNGANQEKIAMAGGIPPLVVLLTSGSDEHKVNAAEALNNLSVNGANQEKIASAGGIPPLVALLKSGCDEHKVNAAEALRNIAVNGVNREKIASAGDIFSMIARVTRDNEAKKANAVGTLRNLPANGANLEQIASADGISSIMALVMCGSDEQKEEAISMLWNLAFEKPGIQDLIVAQSGVVDQLVKFVYEGTEPLGENAAGVLGFLASHLPSDVKMKVATQGGIKALILFIIEPENAKWIHEGLIALQGFCTDGNDTIRATVKNFDGGKTLSTIRESGNERNKRLADQILEWLEGDFTGLSELCQRMGEAEPLCTNVMKRIKTLQDSGVDAVGAARTRLRALLVMNGDKSMMVRILSARSLSETLADLHREIDLHEPEVSGERWSSQWKLDKSTMMRKLFATGIPLLTNSLGDTAAQEEALMLVVHEVKQKNSYTTQQRALLQELLNRLAGFSSLGIPVDEKWFIPRTDVQFDDESFNGGAFGQVYHGVYMNADVVVKSVDIKSESDRKDFLREVKVWHEASIHPNIAQFYGACHVGEPCFMVCKYISGGSLRGYLQRQQKLGRDCAWRVLLGVTRGLQLLHSKGIIHADLKGDNILVEGDTAMITDFGMSFFEAETQPDFGDLGAIRWRAPEFIATKKASFEADVYSLGMCL